MADLIIRSSAIHAAGCYTLSPVRKGSIVVEYDGPRVPKAVADDRYAGRDITYLFGLEGTDTVIDGFASSYIAGETPVPCVACNQVVKFHDLLDTARRLGAAALATGHYVTSRARGNARALYRPVDLDRVGIDQQSVGIEPEAFLGIVRSVCAEAVALAGFQAWHEKCVNTFAVRLQFQSLRLAFAIEQADPYALRRARPDGEMDTFRGDGCAEGVF